MKNSPELKKQIVEQVRSVSQTQKELCAHFGITDRTLANWRQADQEFDAALRIAETEREGADRESWRRMLQTLEGPALQSLAKLINGHESRTETKQYKTYRWKDEKGVFHEEEKMETRAVKKFKVEPNLQAIAFVLTNIDPEYFKK